MLKAIYLILLLSLSACGNRVKQKTMASTGSASLKDTIRLLLHDNINFINDSLWKRDPALLEHFIWKYHPDTCCTIKFETTDLKRNYEGPGHPGDINGDHRPDTFYILRDFHLCSEGQSYLFTDTTLPRLKTNSFCCHPRNLFSIGDIDEDGIDELGLFFSSCVSRYKSIYAYSLKKGNWKEVGHIAFDAFYMDAEQSYKSFVRKTGKGKFEMLETADLRKENIGKPVWQKFTVESVSSK